MWNGARSVIPRSLGSDFFLTSSKQTIMLELQTKMHQNRES